MLRPYQRESLNGNDDFPGIYQSLSETGKSLLVLPTGGGKTVVFAHVARTFANQDQRIMIVAHRGELLQQAKDKLISFGKFHPTEIGLEKGDSTILDSMFVPKIVLASKDSLHLKRRKRFDPDMFGLIIIDECHRGVAATYRNIYEHFSSAKVLGVTATPSRKDGKDIRSIFGDASYIYEIKDAIQDQYLVPISLSVIHVDTIDLSKIKESIVDGERDLNNGQLQEVMMLESNLHGVTVPLLKESGDRQTLVFCTGVEHAKSIAAIINRYKANSAIAIDGATGDDDRQRIYRDFHNRKFQYLCNCALLLEGYDESAISCIAMARPTKSKTLYCQAVGRGTRLDGLTYFDSIENGKSDLLLLDFVGNSGKHNLITGFDVVGGIEDNKTRDKAVELAKKGLRVDILKTIEEAETKIAEEEKAKVIAQVGYRVSKLSPFAVLGVYSAAGKGGGYPITEKQYEMLLRVGVKESELQDLDKGQASKLIEEIIHRRQENLCSYKQARLLLKYGIDPNVSFQTASEIMNLISANGWHLDSRLRSTIHQITMNQKREKQNEFFEL